MTDVTMDKIVSLCRRRGFVFPSSEIYGGLGSTYDYGHYGVLMKNNIRSLWFRSMIQERDDMVALDSAVILNPLVWEASGHVAGFTRPADRLPHLQAPVPRRPARGRALRQEAVQAAGRDARLRPHRGAPVQPHVRDAGRRDGGRGRRRRTSAPRRRRASSSTSRTSLQLARRKPPFGIAQVGKSFRNEITPGNFLFRVREFEQMEMEYFVPPDEAQRWYAYWIEQRLQWYLDLGLRREQLRVREHDAEERSHYSSGTSDIEYLYPIGWQELEGVANRGDFDLTQHTKHSGHEARVGRAGRRAVHAARDRAGSVHRAYLRRDARRRATTRRSSPTATAPCCGCIRQIAPVKAAILPLIAQNDGHGPKARALYEELRRRHMVEYDDGGQIGRRYRRQDEIGTPWAFTIDDQTLEDDTVTVRDRDSLAQERLPLSASPRWLEDALERPGVAEAMRPRSLLPLALAAAGCGGTKTVTVTTTVVDGHASRRRRRSRRPARRARRAGDDADGQLRGDPGQRRRGSDRLRAAR